MIGPFASRIMIPMEVVPMFGVAPHTPAKCVDNRARVKRGLSCSTCGRGPRAGSSMLCMDCHRASPGVERFAARHRLEETKHDPRLGARDAYADHRAEMAEAAKAKPANPAKPVKLTAKDRKALMRDARAGEHPLPIVELFLASQPA